MSLPKPYYDDGQIQIYHGDCMEVLPLLPTGSVDLVLADPPYNNGTQYEGYDDRRTDYKEWCQGWFAECRRIAGRVIITPGHGNLWMWGEIEKPWGIGCWYKPGNPATSVLGWVCWEPWLYYTTDYRALGGPDTIRATVSQQSGIGNHPCPKPLGLFVEMIGKTTKPDAVILDPFVGSGTTLRAAKDLGRRAIGIELEEKYCAIAANRLSQGVLDLVF